MTIIEPLKRVNFIPLPKCCQKFFYEKAHHDGVHVRIIILWLSNVNAELNQKVKFSVFILNLDL